MARQGERVGGSRTRMAMIKCWAFVPR
jgi:hypothetical protein